jgi:effector-binding domain-containing protein
MLKKILLGVVALVLLLVAVAYALPRQRHVERSIVIDRDASVVHALVNSYRRFDEWSPWAERDPRMEVVRSGPEAGVGATYEWSGNEQVGAGSQRIVESVPNERVTTALAFGGQPPATARFLLAPTGGGTRVTWTLETDAGLNPVARWVGLALDGMVGPDYERGLARLKTLAETLPRTPLTALEVERVDVAAQPLLVAATRSAADPDAVARAYGAAFAQIGAAMAKAGVRPAGPPLGISAVPPSSGEYAFEAAMPVDRPVTSPPPPVVAREGYAGPALKTVHVGPHAALAPTYDRLAAFAAAYGYRIVGPMWAAYVDDAATTPPPQLRTEVYAPIAP